MRANTSLYTTLLALIAVSAIATVAPAPKAAAETSRVAGPARVIDADTLEIDGHRIRLEGIDAPEKAQKCPNRVWGAWPCGTQAIDWLGKFIASREVSCQIDGRDAYRRLLGTCSVGGDEINRTMVRQGQAWAFTKYSTVYASEQRFAEQDRVGIWSGSAAEPPWSFRQRRWAIAEQRAPNGCAIKGNISARGKVYHPPWSNWYNRVRVSQARGERWFCSEGEAVAAGWRPAYGT